MMVLGQEREEYQAAKFKHEQQQRLKAGRRGRLERCTFFKVCWEWLEGTAKGNPRI